MVSVVGGIQPDVLGDLRDRNGKEDGFVERFILIRPDVQRRGWSEDEASPDLLDAVVEAMKKIDAALPPKDADNPELTVRLHPDARAVWRRWYDAIEEEAEASSGLRAGVLGKLPLQVARIALILNTLRNLDDPQLMVSEAVMRDAIRLGSFIVTHWDRCLPLIAQSAPIASDPVPGRLLNVLRDERERDADVWVSRTRIVERVRSATPDAITAALRSLAADGIAERTTETSGRKPRELWRVVRRNSRFLDDKLDSSYSSYSPAERENWSNWNPVSPTRPESDPFPDPDAGRSAEVVSLDDHRTKPLIATGTDDDDLGVW